MHARSTQPYGPEVCGVPSWNHTLSSRHDLICRIRTRQTEGQVPYTNTPICGKTSSVGPGTPPHFPTTPVPRPFSGPTRVILGDSFLPDEGFDCVSLGPTQFKELFRRNFGVLLHPRDLGILVNHGCCCMLFVVCCGLFICGAVGWVELVVVLRC